MTTHRLQRDVPVEDGYDLVVAGGGPAGSAAAVCGARRGAKVLLVEATGCLGGMATSGLVTAFDPMADGERMLVGGFMRQVVESMYARGFLAPQVTPDYWLKRYHTWTPFRVEGLKLLLDELAVEAGVEVRFFTRVIDAEADAPAGRVHGAILHNVEGYRFVRAKAFIDATGDAVLADAAGAACRAAGRDTERIMPATLCSLHANVDWDRCNGRVQYDALQAAVAAGHFTQPDLHYPGLSRVGRTLGYLNAGHLFNLDALRCRSLTDGMMLGRRIVQEYAAFLRRHVPGCEDIELVTTASLMGVRESRRIVGEYELTLDDYLARRQFPDQIGVFNKFVDVHPYDCSRQELQRFRDEQKNLRLERGECFGIPYGVIVPRGWRNLWVAGRPNSSDVAVHGSIRVQPAAAMMGQAAGTAAVQSIATGQPACDLDTQQLVAALRDDGAYLPQPNLSPTMTR